MKIFIYSHNSNLNHYLDEITGHSFEVVDITSEEELFEHEFEKCILVIDIDSVKDHGFSLASKLASKPEKKYLIVGVTTLEVNSRDSKFDFFFNSFKELKECFETVVEKYEKI